MRCGFDLRLTPQGGVGGEAFALQRAGHHRMKLRRESSELPPLVGLPVTRSFAIRIANHLVGRTRPAEHVDHFVDGEKDSPHANR